MSRNLFIPPLGTEIELAQDWTFALYGESRNHDFFDYLKTAYLSPYSNSPMGCRWEMRSTEVTLPAGSVLKVDRIYIRKGQNDFDSVTFYLTRSNGKKVTKARFWVKLEDANKIIIRGE